MAEAVACLITIGDDDSISITLINDMEPEFYAVIAATLVAECIRRGVTRKMIDAATDIAVEDNDGLDPPEDVPEPIIMG